MKIQKQPRDHHASKAQQKPQKKPAEQRISLTVLYFGAWLLSITILLSAGFGSQLSMRHAMNATANTTATLSICQHNMSMQQAMQLNYSQWAGQLRACNPNANASSPCLGQLYGYLNGTIVGYRITC